MALGEQMSKGSGKGGEGMEQPFSHRRRENTEQAKMSKQEFDHSWVKIGEQRQD